MSDCGEHNSTFDYLAYDFTSSATKVTQGEMDMITEKMKRLQELHKGEAKYNLWDGEFKL